MDNTNKTSKGRARKLRRNQTDAERHLWQLLRNRQLGGHKFRRQHTMGPYVVDFTCLEQRLILEIDGGQHQDRQQYDQQRDEFLVTSGFRVLRFWNNEVLGNIEGVMQVILQKLLTAPDPSPLPSGEREQKPTAAEVLTNP